MWTKQIYLMSFVLVLVLAAPSPAGLDDDPNLVAWWKFDGDATDSSGNGHHGTLMGDPAPVFADGMIDQALDTTESGGPGYVEITGYDGILGPNPFSIAMWINTSDGGGTIMGWGSTAGGATRVEFRIDNDRLRCESSGNVQGDTTLPDNEWIHVAVTVKAGAIIDDPDVTLYLNGENDTRTSTGSNNPLDMAAGNDVTIARRHTSGRWLDALFDDVRIYNRELTPEEVKALATPPRAHKPSPEDGGILGDTWVSLKWSASYDAVSHDVYMGTNFDDVNDGTGETFQGNQTTTDVLMGFAGFLYPEGLSLGTTYYWRVDEVLADGTKQRGHVWSFLVPPRTAYNTDPPDGAKFIGTDVTLSWMAGFHAKLHYVHFGDNFDDVNNAVVGLSLTDAAYTPGALELDKTYYWRVDEFDGAQTIEGNVWSFKTMPVIPVTDPNLICWWTLEEGSGTNVLDWSGHGNHGTFNNDPKWVDGYDGSALQFDGVNDSVIYYLPEEETWSAYTVALWAKADVVSQSLNSCVFANHMTFATDTPSMQISYDDSDNYQYHGPIDAIIGPATLTWVHLCVTGEGSNVSLYYNGDLVTSFDHGTGDTVFTKFAIAINRAEDNWFEGSIDDCRVYNRALTQEEVQLAMRGDLMLAWKPGPADGSLLNLRDAGPLSFSPGDNASEHDVYFGTDKDAVSNADASDTTGVYRGRQGSTSYNATQDVEWGGGPYYWRIDEVNIDGSISKGRIWSFSVADFIGVDDFESYNDLDPDDPASNRIFNTWIDGFDNPAINGSIVGYTNPPFAERTIVHGGSQSMPLAYDNAVGISETTLTLTYPRDWTENGVSNLVIWYIGDAANIPETMYVVLYGTAGVDNDNPDAALDDTWTEWTIDLQLFADQGVNLTNVNTITLGFGNRNNPVAGGSGMVFFDDIRLYALEPAVP